MTPAARRTVRFADRGLLAAEAGVARGGQLPAALRLQALLQHLWRQGLRQTLRRLQVQSNLAVVETHLLLADDFSQTRRFKSVGLACQIKKLPLLPQNCQLFGEDV